MMRLLAHDHTIHQPRSFYTRGRDGGAEDRGIHSTARGMDTHVSPHSSTPGWIWAQSRPYVPPRASYTQLGVAKFDVHRATTDTLAPSSTYTCPPFRETLHSTSASTSPSNLEVWSGRCTCTADAPPPLDFAKSPYSCIPLPPISPPLSPPPAPPRRQRMPTLNPILAYSHSSYSAQTTPQLQFASHHYNIDVPATDPKLGSITILLSDGSGLTVHAAQGRGFVTVGDVLDAVDKMFLGNRSLRPLGIEGSYDAWDRGRCGCFCVFGGSRGSVLDELRMRYVPAGLVWQSGVDCWELRVG